MADSQAPLLVHLKAKILFIIFSSVFTVVWLSDKPLFPVELRPDEVSDSPYAAVPSYLRVAAVAREKGAIYGDFIDDAYQVYNPSPNDPGYPALVGIYTILGGDAYFLVDLAQLNIRFYWGTIFLTLIANIILFRDFFRAFLWLLLSAIFFQLLGVFHLIGKWPDHHGLVPALATLGAWACFWLFERVSLVHVQRDTFGTSVLWAVIAGACLAVINLLRSSVAQGLLIGICLVWSLKFLFALCRDKRTRTCLSFGVFMFVLFSSYKFLDYGIQRLYISQTIDRLGLDHHTDPAAGKTYKRGGWHNIYIGLGIFPNSKNIRYNDKVGMFHGFQHNPLYIFPDLKYYDVMRELYFDYLTTYPSEAFVNYMRKANVILKENRVLLLLYCATFAISVTAIFGRDEKARFFRKFLVRCFPVSILCGTGLFLVPLLTHPGFDIGFRIFMSQMLIYTIVRPAFPTPQTVSLRTLRQNLTGQAPVREQPQPNAGNCKQSVFRQTSADLQEFFENRAQT